MPIVVSNGSHITIHAYRGGELLRLVTLGMAKFALPDIAVNDVLASVSKSMAGLINVTCQNFVELGEVTEPGRLLLSLDAIRHARMKADYVKSMRAGAVGTTTIGIAIAKPREGDADNRLIDIVFARDVGGLQERQEAQLAELSGADESIVHVEHDEVLRRARAPKRQ